MSVSVRPPKYSSQKRRGLADRAYTRIAGKKIYLGDYGSPESRAKYNQLVAGGVPTAPHTPEGVTTVADVMVAYLEHSRRYYQQEDGSAGREYGLIHEVLRHLRKQDIAIEAVAFGPKRLKAVRQSLVDSGFSRIFINKQVGRVVRMFRWAASEELVPGDIYTNLSTVEGLRRGRSEARETEPRRPVSDEDVVLTLEHLPQVIADMVWIQRYTGMRGGELVQMRPCDIDRTGAVWFYRPTKHKTQHQGKSRVVAIGPKSQEILLSYLARGDEMYCFRPSDSEQKRQAVRAASRVTPLNEGNTPGSNRKEKTKRTPGEKYSSDSYRRAIARASKKAGVKQRSPHQLRHSAATEVRKAFGLEAAQVVLGHAQASVTEVYAERDLSKAAEVALRIG